MTLNLRSRLRPHTTSLLSWLVAALLAGGGSVLISAASAEDEPEPEDAARASAEPTVAVIRGRNVNLRVGPRQDIRPVRRLDDGCVLLIVERTPGWLGVRVPSGFEVSVAARYTTRVGADAVRVNAERLNLRLNAPEEGAPMPGAFRDHPSFGAVLALIDRTEEWLRVLAPEEIRAYVSDRYVRELGPLSEHREVVEASRALRKSYLAKLAAKRREEAARVGGLRLREALGAAQQALYRLRIEGGYERAPVVRRINTLETAMEQGRGAPVDVRKLARAIRQDLEAELEMRVARKDAEVARLRGLEPEPPEPPAAKADSVIVRGEIRWESAPTWRNGGAFVLWVGEDPTHVLRLTTGLPLPLPDLKGSVGQGERKIEGSQPGDKVFGLPVIEVRTIQRVREKPVRGK